MSGRKLTHEESISIIEDFLNEEGLWYIFKKVLKEKGYDITELGFNDGD